jgi:CHAT domain-containing protein/tetratricopeptide (TPR) repeat protein
MPCARFELKWTAVFAFLVVFSFATGGYCQSDDDPFALHARVLALQQAGNVEEALRLAKRVVELSEKTLPSEHPFIKTSRDNLAALITAQKRSGLQDPSVLRKRVELLLRGGNYGEAGQIGEQYVSAAEAWYGEGSAGHALALGWLAEIRVNQAKFADAESLFLRALAIRERLFGPNHQDVGHVVNGIALLYKEQGRYREAETFYKRALAIAEQKFGPDHRHVGTALNNLAALYKQLGRYAEAEPIYKRSLVIAEKSAGLEDDSVAISLNNLAGLYADQYRLAEAESLYNRAISIFDKLGADHPSLATCLNNLAQLYDIQGRTDEAERLHKRSLASQERVLGPDHPSVANSLNNLAMLYRSRDRNDEAEPLLKRAISVAEAALGPDHRLVATALLNLADVKVSQAKYDEAEPLYRRANSMLERAFGADHPSIGTSINGLGWLYFTQRDWKSAAQYLQQGTDLIVRRSRRDMSIGSGLIGTSKSEAERGTSNFKALIKAAYRLTEISASPARPEIDAFKTAQWAQSSEAAKSVSQMAARQAKGDGALAGLTRERQDLASEWQAKDKLLIGAKSEPPARRNAQAEAELSARLTAIDARIAEIDKTLANHFPDYAALASPEPLSVVDVQTQLRADEVLLLFVDTSELKPLPEETFIWVITKTEMRWVRSEIGTRALAEHIAALRCGLDERAWDEGLAERCREFLPAGPKTELFGLMPAKRLPFDLARAHEVYKTLFGPVQDMIKDKHLLIVPSGPLTNLPFQVLVTAPPASPNFSVAGYAKANWLIKHHAISVLPSVASLKALRQFAKISRASQPFLGIGNPLLLGASGSDRRAWEHQSCPSASPQPIRAAGRTIRTASARFFRGNLANVDLIRNQSPLPETADELCAVARSLGAPESAVHLGGNATETRIKALSTSGTLGNARIVHFATHGLLAGETGSVTSHAEPALILTPPQEPSDEDDGLLTASEVAQLKLDADWVVLSACNTAAGDSDGVNAEALSGLARAFFYAGARALLVSHWAVDSEATVHLITKAFTELEADGRIGRAEALRRSMLALIATGDRNAHPANWAPFVVVGEAGGDETTATSAPPSSGLPATPIAKKKATARKGVAPDWRTEFWRQ